MLVLLLGYTGLRWGEATALRVCDIDLARRRIDVRRASDVGGYVVLGTPKSHQSRTVPVPRFLVREIATAVTGKGPDGLVFTLPNGSPLRLSNWRPGRVLARLRPGRDQHPIPHVESARGAVPVLPPARFPGPLAEPAVPISR